MSNVTEIPVAKLTGTHYARILIYPSSDETKARERVRELSSLGVVSLIFTGATLIDGVPVLGKGCVGIVVLAMLDDVPVALKIRRSDADRATMSNEGRLLRVANSVNVGPRLITQTKNFLAMQFIKGLPLFRWAEGQSAGKMRATKTVVGELLSSCFRLDAIGLDHGELSHAPRNVLIDKSDSPWIVDFESASTTRRTANVTSLLQYFLYGRISKSLNAPKIFPRKGKIIRALTEYKRDSTVENFDRVLRVLDLT